MILKSLTEAHAALAPYITLAAQLTGKNITLERMWPLLEVLDNPHKKLRVIHIAGTSGKTSTAYYIAALLTATGKQVGLGVSPHIDSITERVQINGRPLSEAEFCGQLGEFLDIIQAANQQPSHFELLQAFTFWVFARKGVDYAVIETGLGGLHDASNVAQRPDKVCVITDIGLDHTNVLGNTVAAISRQKIGITHESNHILMYEQAPVVMEVVRLHAQKQHASLELIGEAGEGILTDLPTYQARNWGLAYAVYEYLQERDGLEHLTRQALHGTQKIQIPGRMDTKKIGTKTIVMDGAHNAQKMTAFVEAFRQLYPSARPAILVGMKETKDYQQVVNIVAPMASRVITTGFAVTQDLPVRSLEPSELAAAFTARGVPAQALTEHAEALQALLNGTEEVCIITGSFYLLGQLRTQPLLTA